MAEHRILFPRDERTARDVEESRVDERSDLEFESLTALQKIELLHQLTRHLPQLRPWNLQSGKFVAAAEISALLPVLVEVRRNALNKDFGRLLDRVHAKATKSRELGLPIWFFL